jgi:hypothetical protein
VEAETEDNDGSGSCQNGCDNADNSEIFLFHCFSNWNIVSLSGKKQKLYQINSEF